VWRGSGAEDSGTGGVDIIGTARDGAVVGQKGKDSEVYEGGGLTMTARRREVLQEEERGSGWERCTAAPRRDLGTCPGPLSLSHGVERLRQDSLWR
jgi:hypothetical protein